MLLGIFSLGAKIHRQTYTVLFITFLITDNDLHNLVLKTI